ncbi:MAG: hypothetical protein KC646_12485 [Candidatus Cloacimonetes bacterium]|nr:hypothetical protein [Candidatus Cloacimonadota bacterium]
MTQTSKILAILFFLFSISNAFSTNPPQLFISETLSTSSLLEEKKSIQLKLKKKSPKPPKVLLLDNDNALIFHPEKNNWQITNTLSQKTTLLTSSFNINTFSKKNIAQYQNQLFYTLKNQLMRYNLDSKKHDKLGLPIKISINQLHQSAKALYIYGIDNLFVQYLFVYDFQRQMFKAPIKNFNVSNFAVGAKDELLIIRKNQVIYFLQNSKTPFVMQSNVDPSSGNIFLVNQNVLWHSFKPFVITNRSRIPLKNSVSLKNSIGDIYKSTDHKLYEVSWNVNSSQLSIYKLNEDVYPQD